MQILGISLAHDAGVCLFKDGEIASFYKEERLSGNKRDSDPYLSLIKILEEIEEPIDCLAFSTVVPTDYTNIFSILLKYGYEKDKIKVFDFCQDHHLQHASLAFYNSGFEEANVIVIDRNGSDWFGGARESETIFHASYPCNFDVVYKNFWIYNNYSQEEIKNWSKQNNIETDARSLFGIVKVYESATTLIGQHPLENGKTMGLSSYGNKNANFPNFFVNDTNIPNDFYFSHINTNHANYVSVYHDHYELINEELSQKNYKKFADFAYQVQWQTQNALKSLVKKSVKNNGIKNIVITGGYALNVVANQFLIKNFPEINFYFEPLADDSGNSIGGAMLSYRIETQDKEIRPIKNTFFHGKRYNIDHINGNSCTTLDIARMIVDNKSVALYNGMAEAGPRALGNRSILFNAMNPEAKKIINYIKNREWYRPFALSVLEKDAELYFDMMGQKSNKFMTVCFDALENTKNLFPGVVHIDGSCRIQTVSEEDGPLFEILSQIKKISGHGVVLNTSFNLAGDPLVETPEDALNVLNKSNLDAVWFPEKSIVVLENYSYSNKVETEKIDIEHWVSYNNGYMDGYSDAEAHYDDWMYTNDDNGQMSANDDIAPDVGERRQNDTSNS